MVGTMVFNAPQPFSENRRSIGSRNQPERDTALTEPKLRFGAGVAGSLCQFIPRPRRQNRLKTWEKSWENLAPNRLQKRRSAPRKSLKTHALRWSRSLC